jgi:hypothetical protein
MVTQPNWPWSTQLPESQFRSDMSDADVEPATETYPDGTSASDVVLVAGTWLRYGQKTAWESVG